MLSPSLIEFAAPFDGEEFEIIFVDGSIDNTPIFLAGIQDENPKVRYIHRTAEQGLAKAIKKGFNIAKGDILAVIDADLQHTIFNTGQAMSQKWG